MQKTNSSEGLFTPPPLHHQLRRRLGELPGHGTVDFAFFHFHCRAEKGSGLLLQSCNALELCTKDKSRLSLEIPKLCLVLTDSGSDVTELLQPLVDLNADVTGTGKMLPAVRASKNWCKMERARAPHKAGGHTTLSEQPYENCRLCPVHGWSPRFGSFWQPLLIHSPGEMGQAQCDKASWLYCRGTPLPLGHGM